MDPRDSFTRFLEDGTIQPFAGAFLRARQPAAITGAAWVDRHRLNRQNIFGFERPRGRRDTCNCSRLPTGVNPQECAAN
jgi:hypothetical protein